MSTKYKLNELPGNDKINFLTPEIWSRAAAEVEPLKPPPRPGFGRIGDVDNVAANHFQIKISDHDYRHYDICITPGVATKELGTKIIRKLVEDDPLLLAYDGNNNLYTNRPLQFTSRHSLVEIPEEPNPFKVSIKLVAKIDVKDFISGRLTDAPQDIIKMVDVVLRSAMPPSDYVSFGKSHFSDTLGQESLDEVTECWMGYHQDIHSTQMGLSLNLGITACPFFKPLEVVDFVSNYLNMNDLSKPLSDANCTKVMKVLSGIKVETSHLGYKTCYEVTGLSTKPADQIMFSVSSDESQQSFQQYFEEMYQIRLKYPALPCIQVGQPMEPTYLPMEVCLISKGQKYVQKLNEQQEKNLIAAPCEQPVRRKKSIEKILGDNVKDENETFIQEFGMVISKTCTEVNARTLPRPLILFHLNGLKPQVLPSLGVWSTSDQKVFRSGNVTYWACVNFSKIRDKEIKTFCNRLASMCKDKGMKFSRNPLIPIRQCMNGKIEEALRDVKNRADTELKNKKLDGKLQLLIIVLPDNRGSIYGSIKRICETELGIMSQCCKPSTTKVAEGSDPLQNLAFKINAKVGGSNFLLSDAYSKKIHRLSDYPTIIFGADVTHARPGEDFSASIATVVASMDWPHMVRYKGVYSAQGHGEMIIQDLYKNVEGKHSGMIYELLDAFQKSTGLKPKRIIFYRDGVSEDQSLQVLQHEMDAIRQACAALDSKFQPFVTYVVVQRRHHTRLFPNTEMKDESGNVMPGTVVDNTICHPSQFDFYLCSHAGIQGTSRPAHYHVLYDENHYTADLLQLLTNSLCYTYACCTRSVSVVPAVYYAKLLAVRARSYVKGMTELERQEAEVKVALPRVMDNLKDAMFFC